MEKKDPREDASPRTNPEIERIPVLTFLVFISLPEVALAWLTLSATWIGACLVDLSETLFPLFEGLGLLGTLILLSGRV